MLPAIADTALQCSNVACLLVGSWEAGSQRTRAYALKFFGSSGGAVIAFTHGVWSGGIIGAVLACLQIRAIVKWRRAGIRW